MHQRLKRLAHSDAIFADGSHVRDSLDDLLGFASGAVLQPMGVHGDIFRPNRTASLADLPEAAARFTEGYILCVGRLEHGRLIPNPVDLLRKNAS